ncbi:MAG: hypothetical protein ACLU4J_00180 [Butyricimonas paravirosa]
MSLETQAYRRELVEPVKPIVFVGSGNARWVNLFYRSGERLAEVH